MVDPFTRCGSELPDDNEDPIIQDCEIPEPPELIEECQNLSLILPPAPPEITIPCPVISPEDWAVERDPNLRAGDLPTIEPEITIPEPLEGTPCYSKLSVTLKIPDIVCPTITEVSTSVEEGDPTDPVELSAEPEMLGDLADCQTKINLLLKVPTPVCPSSTVGTTAVSSLDFDAAPEVTAEFVNSGDPGECLSTFNFDLKVPSPVTIPCPGLSVSTATEVVGSEELPELTAEVIPTGATVGDGCAFDLRLQLKLPQLSLEDLDIPCPTVVPSSSLSFVPIGSPASFTVTSLEDPIVDGECRLLLDFNLQLPSPTPNQPNVAQALPIFLVQMTSPCTCSSPGIGVTQMAVFRPNGQLLPVGSEVLVQATAMAGYLPTGALTRVTWPSENVDSSPNSLATTSVTGGMFNAIAQLQADLSNNQVVPATLVGFPPSASPIFVRSVGCVAPAGAKVEAEWDSGTCEWVAHPRPVIVELITPLKGGCGSAPAEIVGGTQQIHVDGADASGYYLGGSKILVTFENNQYKPLESGAKLFRAKTTEAAEDDAETEVQVDGYSEPAINKSGGGVEPDSDVLVEWNEEDCRFEIFNSGGGGGGGVAVLLTPLSNSGPAQAMLMKPSGSGWTSTGNQVEIHINPFLTGQPIEIGEYVGFIKTSGGRNLAVVVRDCPSD